MVCLYETHTHTEYMSVFIFVVLFDVKENLRIRQQNKIEKKTVLRVCEIEGERERKKVKKNTK